MDSIARYKILFCLSLILSILSTSLFAQKVDSTSNKMEELVISADRFQEKIKDLPRQIDVLSKKQIELWNKQNTADLLQETGNVFIQKSQQGGGSPVMRGFEANRILLVVDGIRLNNAIYRSGHLQNILRIDQNMLQNVELVYGPGGLVYGSDAMGGVIHFSTQKPSFNKGITGNYSGRFSTVNSEINNSISLGYSSNKISFSGNFTASNYGDLRQGKNRPSSMGTLGLRNFYQAREANKDIIKQNTSPELQIGSAYQQKNGMAKLTFKPSTKQQHTLEYIGSISSNVPRYDRLSESKKDTPTYGEWYYGPEKFNLISYQFEDTKSRLISNQIKLTSSFQSIEESRVSRNFGSSKRTFRTENVKVYSLNLDLRKIIGIHEIKYGLEYVLNDVQSKANALNINTNAISNASTRYPDGGSTMWWTAAYLNINQEITPKLILSEGLRVSHTQLKSTFKDKTFYEFLPNTIEQKNTSLCGSLGLVYLVQKNSKVYANIGNAFRTPNVDDMGKIFDSKSGSAMILPNPNLKPEQSVSAEIGTLIKATDKLSIEANVFYTKLWNAILTQKTTLNDSDSLIYDGKLTPVYSLQNSQNGYQYGLNFQVAYYFSTKLVLQSSINYTYGRIIGDSVMPIDHIAPLFGKTSLTYSYHKIQASLYSLYSGTKKLKDYYLNGEDNLQYATPTGMPSWYTLNIQTSYSFLKSNTLRLGLGIENILDRNYRTFSSGISSPGRNFWINVALKF
ncbi:MAG: TonB-dependent receptor [Bacteroidetes bacterium B1(2017)]|nr:MAG: TonB-dependent receptor [Bacteroidetes bacterium B1(2017)]